MALEVGGGSVACYRCGTSYPTKKGYFQICYGALYKGAGYLPYCKQCVDDMYMEYLAQCNSIEQAVRQTCRKLDLYWNEGVCRSVIGTNAPKSTMSSYITKLNRMYAGKAYDDTLIEEDALWQFGKYNGIKRQSVQLITDEDIPDPTEDVVSFWGPGYTPEMYAELEQRFNYYRSQMDDADRNMSTDALLRQIAMLEIDINRTRAEGKAVDKMVSTLNSLLSSLVKPTKKNDDINSSASNTPLGVWIKRWEDERPLPEIDESLKDVDGIIKYVLTWVYGHVAHMLKVKNANTKLYDDAIARLRVERPEYDDEDDDSMLYSIFGDGNETG